MKILFYCFFILCTTGSFAQLSVDPAVKKKYDAAHAKIKSTYRQNMEQLGKNDPSVGFVLFKIYQDDTLNKNELIKHNVTITLRDENGQILNNDEEEEFSIINMPYPSTCRLYNDTLQLSIGIMFPALRHIITSGKLTSFYDEFYKDDLILRLKLSDEKLSRLAVSVKTTKFILNTLEFKKENMLYGEVEFETLPYYIDDPGFKNNYIHKQFRGSYIFKIPIQIN